MFPMTPWTRRLLIANVVMFFATAYSADLRYLLPFSPQRVLQQPWMVFTAFTYMFLHGGLAHLAFNMIGLFFFGPRLESRLGTKGFLLLYFLSGLGGAAFHFAFARQAAMVGASAAVYGVLLGFAMYWPRERIYIWFVIPVEAWLIAVLLVFGSLWAGINPGPGSNTAHFAHLGGLVVAYLFLRWWDWYIGIAKRDFQRKLRAEASSSFIMGDRVALARWRGISVESLHELNRGEVERLLAKAEREGPKSLSPPERDFMDRMSRG
jgi:membrane associated rhomboid family serine protease